MIRQLRIVVTITTTISLTLVMLGAVFVLMMSANTTTMNLMNSCLDAISIQDESLTFSKSDSNMEGDVPRNLVNMSALYAIHVDAQGNVRKIFSRNSESMSIPVTTEELKEYAQEATESERRGWAGPFRYKVMENPDGSKTVLMADSYLMRQVANNQAESAIGILAIVYAIVLIVMVVVIFFVTEHAERAYRAQKRFVANAEHEMKTPLAVITMDLDLLEMTTGKSEWIDDMRAEAKSLTNLAAKLVDMSRLDEKGGHIELQDVDMSAIAQDVVSAASEKAALQGLTLTSDIYPNCKVTASEAELRSIIHELTTNALKYCDKDGAIKVFLQQDRGFTLFTVENDFEKAADTDVSLMFERFYRSDDARRNSHGHGIGLSYAKDAARALKGSLEGYADADRGIVGFTLKL